MTSALPLPQPPAALLMDFDGVILDSMQLKTQAFATVYGDESVAKREEVLAYQRLHGGVTRRTKFAYFERHIFARSGDAAVVERLANAYRDLVYDAVVACAFVPGAERFLDLARGRIELHLISGTPQDELRNKRLYRITPLGRDALTSWVRDSPVEPPVLKHGVALRVWLGHLADPAAVREVVEDPRAYADEMLAEVTRARRTAGTDPAWTYPELVERWGERYWAAERDLADSMLRDLDELA